MNPVWIKLTGRSGNQLFVNMSLVHFIGVIQEGEYKGMTDIDFSTTQSFCSIVVKESPDEIFSMMKGE